MSEGCAALLRAPETEASHERLVFTAGLFRVRKGLKLGFEVAGRPVPSGVRVSSAARALALGHRLRGAVERGEVEDFAALADRMRVSRAWVSMAVELTFLAPDLQAAVLDSAPGALGMSQLLKVARNASWETQRQMWPELASGKES